MVVVHDMKKCWSEIVRERSIRDWERYLGLGPLIYSGTALSRTDYLGLGALVGNGERYFILGRLCRRSKDLYRCSLQADVFCRYLQC